VSYFTLGKKNCSKDFDMHTSDVRAAAHALEGDVSGRDAVVMMVAWTPSLIVLAVLLRDGR
jgi:hypothetical protein